jgi:hypothetical protein
LTAAKFVPVVFCVLGFGLTNVVEIVILMTLQDFSLIHAQFCDEVIKVWNFGSHLKIADMCWFCKIPCLMGNFVLQALQFQTVVCCKFSGGAGLIFYRFNECLMDGKFNVRT